MDSKARMAMKAVTWQISGFVVMLLIGLAFTGSVSTGGGIAVAGSLLGFINYFGHEMIWARIPWGRRPG